MVKCFQITEIIIKLKKVKFDQHSTMFCDLLGICSIVLTVTNKKQSVLSPRMLSFLYTFSLKNSDHVLKNPEV